MLLSELLKTRRVNYKLTQAQLAEQMFVTTQAVSKWETGKAVPSIDNLLALSDLYNVSIDELVQGSAFFKKPYLVGKKFSLRKAVGLLVFWLLVCLFVTGFGYQPWWLFGIVLLLGIVVVLPVTVKDYWVIATNGIELIQYSDVTWTKFKQIFTGQPTIIRFKYADIQQLNLTYRCRQRMSPFDFNPDYYEVQFMLSDTKIEVPFTVKTGLFLPQFVSYLQRQNVKVVDDQNIVQLLVEDKSLYEHFHATTHSERMN